MSHGVRVGQRVRLIKIGTNFQGLIKKSDNQPNTTNLAMVSHTFHTHTHTHR